MLPRIAKAKKQSAGCNSICITVNNKLTTYINDRQIKK